MFLVYVLSLQLAAGLGPRTLPAVASSWAEAKGLLNSKRCSAVQVTNLTRSLSTLQACWSGANNIDIKRSIRPEFVDEDCKCCCKSIVASSQDSDSAALADLVRGFAILCPLGRGASQGATVRVVVDNDYQARCPNFHVDKVPVRAIATLHGTGTELALDQQNKVIHQASALDMLVLKGTEWPRQHREPLLSSWLSKAAGKSIGGEAHACWHRSPTASARQLRRIILTFDVAAPGEAEWLVGRDSAPATVETTGH